MKNFFNHVRSYVFRGLIAIIPFLLCYSAIMLFYNLIDKQVVGFIGDYFAIKHIPGLGILIILVILYGLGLIVSNIVGKEFFKFLEHVSQQIPLIKVIYGAGKQLSQSLSAVDQEKQAFKRAVLVKMGHGEIMVPAFVMGSMVSPTTCEEFLFVLIPTAPTPASGFVSVVKASQTLDPGWTIEECLKFVVSVGIVQPQNFKLD